MVGTKLLRSIPTIILVVTSIVASIASYLGIVPTNIALPLVLALFAFLGLEEVVSAQNISAMDLSISRLGVEVQELKSLMLKHFGETQGRTAELLDTSVMSDYVKAFAGFQGKYLVFNPRYAMAKLHDQEKLVDEVFAPRYSSKSFERALYLFFVGEKADNENFEIFHSQLIAVARRIRKSIEAKIEVRVIKHPNPDIEFYVGSKAAGKVLIVDWHYPEPVLTSDYGFNLMIYNDALATKYEDTFFRYWQQGEQIPLEELLATSFDLQKYWAKEDH